MGARQFGTGSIAIDTRRLSRILGLDQATGVIEVEAGITWTQILSWLDRNRTNHQSNTMPHGWAIAQKQTGADELTIGGSLASNVHGQGLTKGPIIDDVESFTLLDLEARRMLERVVETIETDAPTTCFDERIASGFQFGDFQFQIDDKGDDFLRHGIFSCYQDAPDNREIPNDHPTLQSDDWLDLLYLTHTEKSADSATINITSFKRIALFIGPTPINTQPTWMVITRKSTGDSTANVPAPK